MANNFKFSNAPLSWKLLATMVIFGTGITYLILIAHIFIDTAFKVSLIKESYGTMDYIELIDITHKYFPYYGIYIFAFLIFTFVLGTSYPERLKRLVAVVPSCLIVLDIGSMWAIRYINSSIFSWGLFFAGNSLAMSFFIIASLSLWDIWFRKEG